MGPRMLNGGAKPEAVVVTVTVALTAEVPFICTELGETVQVDLAGGPLQLSATVLLNPATGARLRV